MGAREAAERGVSAILVVFLLVPLVGFTALAIDISNRTETRQDLWDTLDASALAGASELPDAGDAAASALAYADANYPGTVPSLDFWCVIGRDGSGLPDASHIPFTCDPGPPPYDSANYPGLGCEGNICAIPCDPFGSPPGQCNTMRVSAEETVDYRFAPVIGFDSGTTGVLTTAACKGSCGADVANPADIAMVLDRTGSMNSADVVALQAASRAFLENLRPAEHHVALATLGRSDASPPPGCVTEPSPSDSSGPWVPVSLRNDYDLTDNDPPDDPPALNSSSELVEGIDCLTNSSTGTNLGDSIAAAGSHLLSAGRPGVPAGILFMTDGEANRPSGSPCTHAKTQAANLEALDITIITVAYRLEGVTCGGELATDVLAQMASDPVSGPLTLDDGGDGPGGLPGGCVNAPEIASENADGDHFLCAPDGPELVAVFVAAVEALTSDFGNKVRLVRVPS